MRDKAELEARDWNIRQTLLHLKDAKVPPEALSIIEAVLAENYTAFGEENCNDYLVSVEKPGPCPTCRGSGKRYHATCPTCHGTGVKP